MRRRVNFWAYDQSPEWIPEWIIKAILAVTCFIWGHEPERDMCNHPEHDFCVWCLKSMPNSWTPQPRR